MHAVRYLGELTRCKSWIFETCTKRMARQSGLTAHLPREFAKKRAFMFHFTNSSGITLVGPRVKFVLFESREKPMNPANLPFDSEAMLQGLRGWVECESPTWDAGAVERMLDIAAREMAIMGASIERIAGRQGFAGCVRARFPHPKQGE